MNRSTKSFLQLLFCAKNFLFSLYLWYLRGRGGVGLWCWNAVLLWTWNVKGAKRSRPQRVRPFWSLYPTVNTLFFRFWPEYVSTRIHQTYAYLASGLAVTAAAGVAGARSPLVMSIASRGSLLVLLFNKKIIFL